MNRRRFLHATATATAGLSLAACAAPARLTSLAVQAGDLTMVNFSGTEMTPELGAFLRHHQVRGVILFGENMQSVAQTRALVLELQRVMPPGSLIATDHEGGAVVRFTEYPYPPSAMALGATGDAALAEAVGAAAGRQLAHVGINWNFAPSLDVNSNADNPVIGDRSFGSDPRLVAKLGLAWARGCQSAGVATCVKHFPGHGDTQTDSHYGLPLVERGRAELDAVELYPFAEAAAADVPAFMTAHILFSAFDTDRPATLSPPILTNLLREGWGYDGVIVTDAMRMKAIADNYGREEGAVLALQAGADMVMGLGSDYDELADTLDGVRRALAEGRVPDAVAKQRRLDALGRRFPSYLHPYPAAQQAADAALFANAWARGLTSYQAPAPVAPGRRIVLVVAENVAAVGAAEQGLEGQALDSLLRQHYDVQTVLYDARRPSEAVSTLRALDRNGATVVFATSGRRRADDAMYALIAAAAPDLHLALYNPYLVLDVPAPAVLSYGFRPAALEAVVAWMTGAAPAPGVLPIELTA